MEKQQFQNNSSFPLKGFSDRKMSGVFWLCILQNGNGKTFFASHESCDQQPDGEKDQNNLTGSSWRMMFLNKLIQM